MLMLTQHTTDNIISPWMPDLLHGYNYGLMVVLYPPLLYLITRLIGSQNDVREESDTHKQFPK